MKNILLTGALACLSFASCKPGNGDFNEGNGYRKQIYTIFFPGQDGEEKSFEIERDSGLYKYNQKLQVGYRRRKSRARSPQIGCYQDGGSSSRCVTGTVRIITNK